MHTALGPDPHVLFLVTIIVYVFAALVSFAMWFRNGSSSALPGWAIALLMMAISNFVLFYDSSGARFTVLGAAGTLLAAALTTMWLSLRRLTRTVSLVAIVLVPPIVGCSFLAVFGSVWHLGGPLQIYSLVHLAFVAGLAFLASREAARGAVRHHDLSCLLIALAFAALAIVQLLRTFVVLASIEQLIGMNSAAAITNYARYFGTVCILVATVGLNFLHLETSARDTRP